MISSLSAASGYAQSRPAVTPETEPIPQGLTQAASDFAKVMAGMDSAAKGAMTGTTETHDLVQAIAQAEIALEAAVAIRDKVVEAYQEILRMPV